MILVMTIKTRERLVIYWPALNFVQPTYSLPRTGFQDERNYPQTFFFAAFQQRRDFFAQYKF